MQSNLAESYDALNEELVACRRCPRLVEWRERIGVERRAAFKAEPYWARPVPNFGDPLARRLIVGLAPAAHGANRTGRMFTGDRSGDFLFAALHRAGLANQPDSFNALDGLRLRGAIITASAHCAPPANKPTPDEFAACRPFLVRLIDSREWTAVLCLGGLAWQSAFDTFKALGRATGSRPTFGHGAAVRLSCGTRLLGSYHPSQQNTFTGRLTPAMLDEVLGSFLL
ncbi:MAG TPA: uracil-DNA glycosylase [Fimbriimonadaceae bacterium]|nr:uracil-DNA glycosylase [Fimbriimonadaceae bacterium]